MSHNDPLHPPTEEQRIDWCFSTVLQNVPTMLFRQPVRKGTWMGHSPSTRYMVKLFAHKCFQRYPEFQLKELVDSPTKLTVTKNSTTTYNKRGRNPSDKGKGRGKGKGISFPFFDQRSRVLCLSLACCLAILSVHGQQVTTLMTLPSV
jgi:hypothetical protein